MAPSTLINHEDDIDSRTRWWDSYPARGYNQRTQARDQFANYLDDVFGRPRRLARSASAIGVTYIREAVVSEKPVQRSPTYSALAPSHALPYDLRVPERIVTSVVPRRTATDRWYVDAYSPAKHNETHAAVSRPYVTPAYFWPEFVHVPYYTKVVDKPRFVFDEEGYVRRSQQYLDRYVGDRLRYDDYSLPYVYNSYERKVDNRYLRFIRGAPETFVGCATGLPKYAPAMEMRRIYTLNSRTLY
jgi:hypothetical protein